VLDQICYITALDYQKGYDWKSDSSRESVKCSLVVYADGKLIMKVPVGDVYEVSADPDMHRIIDGQLYTDYSTDLETVIKKNGATLFRYQGREAICGIAVRSDDVYTLGQNRSGDGFAYRKNGEVLFSRPSGVVMGRLRTADDSLCFAYFDRIQSADGPVERYYSVCEGKVTQIAVRDDIKKVWDVAAYGGDIIYLASLTGVSAPVLVSKNGMIALSMPSSLTLVSCRMNVLLDGIFVEGVLTDGNQVQSVLWNEDSRYTLFQKGLTFSAMCKGDDVVHCTLNPASGAGVGLIYRGGETLAMPLGYACMSRSAMDFSSGMLSVGLSSMIGGKPILWVDGQTKELDVNGYISSISSEQQ
jgi:hypothetical protein